MIESLNLLRLKRQIAATGPPPPVVRVGTGHAGIDRAVGGGLARGRLHEVFAAEPADAGSAAGFTGMLAIRLGGGIVWLREDAAEGQGGLLHVAGLAGIGVDPGRLVLVLLPDSLAVLRAAADVVRCPEVGIAVVELRRDPRSLDLTATRRLALAAEASGVTVLLLRIDGTPMPSAAETRWAVRAAASAPLEANAPGQPMLDIEILRQRGRPADGRWQVEWDREQATFRAPVTDRDARGGARETSLSGALVPLPVGRSAKAGAVVVARRSTG